MRAREFIVEYREDITRRQYGDAIAKLMVDQNTIDGGIYGYNKQFPTKDSLLDAAFKRFESGDPTFNPETKTGGMYIPWIAREYARGNIRSLEDCDSRVLGALARYHIYKKRADFKSKFPQLNDIMRVQWNDLEGAMDRYEPKQELTNRGTAETLYDGSDARVIVPRDVAAACYYGQGTRWCTAATRGENYFEHYNRQGPLYILLPKKPQREGEKYQLHPESNQYMDENDSPVSLDKIYERFPDALREIASVDKSFRGLLVFMPPDDVMEIWKKITELALDIIIEGKYYGDNDIRYLRKEFNIPYSQLMNIMRMYYSKYHSSYVGVNPTHLKYLVSDIIDESTNYFADAKTGVMSEFRKRVYIIPNNFLEKIKTNKDYLSSTFMGTILSQGNYEVVLTAGDWSVVLKEKDGGK